MLWAIFVALLILWLLGFLFFHVGGSLIHVLLVVALVVLVIKVVKGPAVTDKP